MYIYLSPIGDLLRQHEVKFHMYADDIQIYVEFDPKIPNDAECGLFKLSKCISDVQHWMSSNKLQLNGEKTEFIIASSSCNYKHLAHLTLTINNSTLHPSTSIRNLGVVFDNTMSMSDHVTSVCKSANYHLRNINRI